MSDPDFAADCVACTWACSTAGTAFGEEKATTLAAAHYRTCDPSDCVLLKRVGWDAACGQKVEEVIGQVNADGLRVDGGEEVRA